MRHSAKYYLVILLSMSLATAIPTFIAIHFQLETLSALVLLCVVVFGIGFPLDRALDNSIRGTLPIPPRSK